MHLGKLPCEKTAMRRHSAKMRATAALLAGLLALAPAAQAAAQKTPVVVLPFAAFPGLPDNIPSRLGEMIAQELKGREELRLVEPKAQPPRADDGSLSQAKAALGKAAELARKSRHAASADALQRAISLLTVNPSALDESAGKLLSDAELQLAVERLVAGDEDGGDLALAQLVRLSPQRELNKADYPPAFLVELAGVRRRMLEAPRGSVRVLAAPGTGAAQVFLDGRLLRDAPVLIEELIPGEHFLRVARGGLAWGEKVVVIAGVETRVAPQPGADGAAGELTGALLQGSLDRGAVVAAGRLARAAGAQAAVFGAVLKSQGGVTVRPFLVKGERVAALAPIELDSELLGGVVQMVKLGDEVVSKIAAPPAEPPLPLVLGAVSQPIPEVAAAPAAPAPPAVAVPIAPLVAQAPISPAPPKPEAAPVQEPARRVALPGAAVAPLPAPARVVPAPQPSRAEEPPSRALVIPRQAAPDDTPPVAAAKPAAKPPPAQHLQALEPDAIKTVHEAPPPKNHTALWIVAGVLVVGAAAVGGYLIYENAQTPTTATVNASW